MDTENDATPKPPDAGGDRLPFDQMEHRRFEILAYRLKSMAASDPAVRVALMQGVGERGRDLIVYRGGAVTEIVQCKNLRDRIDARLVRRELLKLAFHALLEPTILGQGPVRYELWCPGGFSEPAALIIDTWPNEWHDATLFADAAHVLRSYTAFSDLSWQDAKAYVTEDFPKLVRLHRLDAIDLSPLVKQHVTLYEAFFEGKVVMGSADVEDSLRRIMAEQARYLNDTDARHVLDRIGSFAANERLVFMSTLVMGVSPDLVSKFRRAEYEGFAKVLIATTHGIVNVILNASARIRGEVVRDFRLRIGPTNKSLPHVVGKVLTVSMAARLTLMMTAGLNLQPGLAKYDAQPMAARCEAHIEETWDEYQRCIAGYDPKKHPPASDEEIRHRIARIALEGFGTRKAFEADLRRAYKTHEREVGAVFTSWMALVPSQLLIVADTKSIFEKGYLLDRMIATTARLEELRGSPTLPE